MKVQIYSRLTMAAAEHCAPFPTPIEVSKCIPVYGNPVRISLR